MEKNKWFHFINLNGSSEDGFFIICLTPKRAGTTMMSHEIWIKLDMPESNQIVERLHFDK